MCFTSMRKVEKERVVYAIWKKNVQYYPTFVAITA